MSFWQDRKGNHPTCEGSHLTETCGRDYLARFPRALTLRLPGSVSAEAQLLRHKDLCFALERAGTVDDGASDPLPEPSYPLLAESHGSRPGYTLKMLATKAMGDA